MDGAGVGVTGVGGCWSKCCSGGERGHGRAETRREDVSWGEERERFAPDLFPSWLQWERGEGRGLVAPAAPRSETRTPEAAGMGFTGWESRLVLKQASTRAGERGQLGRGGVHLSLLILFLIMFLSGNGGGVSM